MKRPSISIEDWRARVVDPILLGSLFFTLIHAWILTFYYQVPYNLRIGWVPVDGSQALGSSYSFGVHYFSDYTFTHLLTLEKAPWDSAITIYPPLTMLFVKAFNSNPARNGLFVFLYIGVLFSLAPLIHATLRRPLKEVLFLVGFCGIASAGLIAAFDRGNPILFLAPLIYFAYERMKKSKDASAGFLLGLAISIKIYPILLLPLLLLRRKFKASIIAVFTFIVGNFLAALVWGNPISIFRNFYRNINGFGSSSMIGDPTFMSATEITGNLTRALHLESNRVLAVVLNHPMFLSAALFLLIVVACIDSPLSEIFLFGLITMELIPLRSFSYTRVWTLAAAAILISLEKVVRDGSTEKLGTNVVLPAKNYKLWWLVVVLYTTPFTVFLLGNSLAVLVGFCAFLYLLALNIFTKVPILIKRLQKSRLGVLE